MPFHDVCVCFLFFISDNPPIYTYCTYPCYIKPSLSTRFIFHDPTQSLDGPGAFFQIRLALLTCFALIRNPRPFGVEGTWLSANHFPVFTIFFFIFAAPKFFLFTLLVNDTSSNTSLPVPIDPTISWCSVQFSHQWCGPVWLPAPCARLLPRPVSWPRWPRRCSRLDLQLWIAPGPCWRHIRVLPSAGERLPTATREYVNSNLNMLYYGSRNIQGSGYNI